MYIGILRKQVFLEILGNFFLTGVVGLTAAGYYTTKSGLLTKFSWGVLHILQNFEKIVFKEASANMFSVE